MIKQLRRKFIVIALASVAIVLLVIVGGINISNYVSVMSREDARADLVGRDALRSSFLSCFVRSRSSLICRS